jgi:hypothetical protein
MPTEADPIVGNWYQHLDKGQRFVVVAVDSDDGLIEVQYFDGDVEEIDNDIWHEMELERVEAPENWAGALDIAELDDLSSSVTDTTPTDWSDPLTEIRGSDSAGNSGTKEEDDWGEGFPQEEPIEGELV